MTVAHHTEEVHVRSFRDEKSSMDLLSARYVHWMNNVSTVDFRVGRCCDDGGVSMVN